MSPCIIRGQRQGSSIFLLLTQHMPQSHKSHTGLQLCWSNKLVTGLRILTSHVASMLHNAQVLRIIYFSHSQCHLQFASLMLTTQKVNALFLNKT